MTTSNWRLVASRQKSVKLRALVPALGPADAVVLVHLDDVAAHPSGNLPKLPFLVCGGLFPGTDPEIQGGSTHWGDPPISPPT